MKKSKRMTVIIITACIVAAAATGVALFLHGQQFGSLPQGARLERVRRSPNYRDGEFRNLEPTALMTSEKGMWSSMWEFLFGSKKGLEPDSAIEAVKTDLRGIPPEENVMVWFGHSSYLLQVDGRRTLVDPVFHAASPVSFVGKPFAGTDIYKPEDMPDIDYLIITHDHWDHLDYRTVKAMKGRIRKVLCPLGVGAHFERWGFENERIVELDWDDDTRLDSGFTAHCLPSRHFSGRGLKSNQSLWASFVLETPTKRIFVGGDGGYGRHLKKIGERFPGMDLAVIENGQYNEDWRYIHTMPSQLDSVARDLGAKRYVTVHHSKFALARHSWDEPLRNERAMREDSINVIIPKIGEVTRIGE